MDQENGEAVIDVDRYNSETLDCLASKAAVLLICFQEQAFFFLFFENSLLNCLQHIMKLEICNLVYTITG